MHNLSGRKLRCSIIFQFYLRCINCKVNMPFKNLKWENSQDQFTCYIYVCWSFLFFMISKAANWYDMKSTSISNSFPLKISLPDLWPCVLCLRPSTEDSALLAVVSHKDSHDPVNTNPAADVEATAGTLVSLPEQLCHQRWVVSLAMMDDSDKFGHLIQPTQLLD